MENGDRGEENNDAVLNHGGMPNGTFQEQDVNGIGYGEEANGTGTQQSITDDGSATSNIIQDYFSDDADDSNYDGEDEDEEERLRKTLWRRALFHNRLITRLLLLSEVIKFAQSQTPGGERELARRHVYRIWPMVAPPPAPLRLLYDALVAFEDMVGDIFDFFSEDREEERGRRRVRAGSIQREAERGMERR